jgi:hypothetical protein
MSTITELRLQLLANGYSPIRNRDKRTFMPGWPTVELTPAEIEMWGHKHKRDSATGLRVENGLAVIDFDINDKTAMNLIADRVFEAIPELGDPNANLLVRTGKGAKEAWFVRTDEEFGRIHSRSYTRPGESVDAGTHRVEVFGGSSARQFGSFGPHTIRDDGVVEVEYAWPERSPLDTRQSELPELTKQQFFRIADIAEAVLKELGWSAVERSKSGENDAVRVYDLTEDMHFDLASGDTVSLQRLRDLAAADPDGGLRCSASFLEGAEAVNRTRCLITVTRTGNLAIWESASGVTHCEASLKPVQRDYQVAINRILEMEAERKDKRKNRIHGGDRATAAAAKLLRSFAFCEYQQASMVPLWATSMDDAVMIEKMRLKMLPNCDEEQGPRGGITRINPIDLWMSSEERINVRGARLRPDKERPTYEEDGRVWVNIYAPPEHVAEGGSAEGGKVLLQQLFPDDAQRKYFTQLLAHKVRFPHIPGPATVMVARGFGTGRGTLAELIRRLFGAAYVQQLPFEAFSGKTYQSQYNEWQATALVVIVNESSESDGSTFQTKRNTYERLKEIVDPAPTERSIFVKRDKNYRAVSFTTYIIATNHEDALPIPADDRRFFVASNGEPQSEEFWQEMRDWMDAPANVAAFYHWLAEVVDISDFNPFAPPPRTEAKMTMVEAGQSDLDRGIAAGAAEVGDLFTFDQLVHAMDKAKREHNLEYPREWTHILRRRIASVFFRVGERDGTNWQVKFEGRKHAVYAKSRDLSRDWKTRHGLRLAVFGRDDEGEPKPEGNVTSLESARSLKQSLKNVTMRDR